MRTLSGDGYYQELDEARFFGDDIEEDFSCENSGKAYKQKRNEISYRDEKYFEIDEKLEKETNFTRGSRAWRAMFCKERDMVHKERASAFLKNKEEWGKTNPPKSQVFCKCKTCGGGFVARVVDRKRGWGKFCSKSCKAQC